MTFADRITIGIPAFNESRHIADALASVSGQSRHIIVSDNGSDDDTAEICSKSAVTNTDIQLFRHTDNRGATFNFKFLLDQCRTEYFMWLGAHDRIPRNYTSTLIAILDDHPEAVMAYGDSIRIDLNGNPVRTEKHAMLKQHLESVKRAERMQAIVKYLTDCSLIHGVWRAEGLRRAWVEGKYLGVDHVILLNASAIGTLRHTRSTNLLRRNPRRSDSHTLQLQRMTGGESRKSPTYTEMYLTQLRIVYATLGIGACLTATINILGRLGAFNLKSYLKLLGISGKRSRQSSQ
jgi:glycosyltransferase involved in cell wall biosynthesis